MNRVRAWSAAVAAALLVSACSSGVTREAAPAGTAGQALPAMPVGKVTLAFSPEGQKAAAENEKFNRDQFLGTVQKAMRAGNVLRDGRAESAEIVLTSVRVRGTFSAVMWGVMAGTDNVQGDVVVRDAGGKVLRKFTVNASYGLGGVAGADDTRLTWLYDKFAEHTVAELSGKPVQ